MTHSASAAQLHERSDSKHGFNNTDENLIYKI